MEAILFTVVAFIVLGSLAMMIPLITNEGFTTYVPGYPTNQLCKVPLTTEKPREPGPADATLDNPRTPYSLLGDYLQVASDDSRLANFTSECAYIADGQRHIEKTGSYGQVTNNYKHKKPDNGTTLLHELSVSFYK